MPVRAARIEGSGTNRGLRSAAVVVAHFKLFDGATGSSEVYYHGHPFFEGKGWSGIRSLRIHGKQKNVNRFGPPGRNPGRRYGWKSARRA